ncbi:MAG: hypothetical protein ABSE77_16120 [Acidimicrobiales bacterium]
MHDRPWLLHVWLDRTRLGRAWSTGLQSVRIRRPRIGVDLTGLFQRWPRHIRLSHTWRADRQAGQRPEDVDRQSKAAGGAMLTFE